MIDRICNDGIIAKINFQFLISFKNPNQKFCGISESKDLTREKQIEL